MRSNERWISTFSIILFCIIISFGILCCTNSGSPDPDPDPTYSISGQVTSDGAGLSGVTVTLSGTSSGAKTADNNGDYSFSGLSNGSYTVTVSSSNSRILFSPTSNDVTISGTNVSGVDFTASEKEALEEIGSDGGTVEVTDPTSQIFGTRVEIPPGATAEDIVITISIKENPPAMTNPYIMRDNPVIEFSTISGENTFSEPLSIFIPTDEFDINQPQIPGVAYYNEEESEWEIIPSDYDFDEINLKFTTNHFSIFTSVRILIPQNIYEIFTTGTEIQNDLVEMANEIIGGSTCSILRFSKNYFLELKDLAYNHAEDIADIHNWCADGWICGGKGFQEWFRDKIAGQMITLALGKILVAAGGVGVAGPILLSVGSIIATPCALCLLWTSGISPDFWASLAISWAAEQGNVLAQNALDDLGCEEGELFFSNFDDGTLQGWGTRDNSHISTEKSYSGAYSIKVHDDKQGGDMAECYRVFSPPLSEGISEFWMYVPSGNVAANTILLTDQSAWHKYPNARFRINFWTDGRVQYYHQGANHDFPTPASILFNTWNKITLAWDSSNNQVRLAINGVNYGIGFEHMQGEDIQQIEFMSGCWSCVGIYAYFDDVKVLEIN